MSDKSGVGWQELASWDRRLAISETIAHLESMRIDGKLEKITKNSSIYYQRT